jgi:tetratricopeptide (TPR) repeat protein
MGSYRLQSHLGSGGMGIVFKAFDRTLKRTVAVKVLRPERAEGAPRARFVREAEATASLEDDHIISVFAVANPPNAPPYFAMQYVDGPSLRDLIRQRQVLEARTAADMALQIADGLAAAHRAGLIHRDIKPANILWDQTQGRARITDFGLVRAMANPDGHTQDGALPGTPEYMSPEQVSEPANVDERTDLYSLGVTLYEMLIGKVPFTGSPHNVLERVLHDEPLPPRRMNSKVPRDLETICLKAMARERTRRYQTAKEFRDDLRRWLDGQPIHARPVGVCERLLGWCWRNPMLAGLIGALVLVFASGLGAVLWQWRRAEANADQARTVQEPAEARTLFEEKLANNVKNDWEGTIAEYVELLADRPTDGNLRSELFSAYQAAGRTREAIPHLAKASAAIPMDTALSHDVAALQAWFGQDKEFAATRQRILAFAKDTKEAMTAERAAKVCSILPYTDKGELEAALALGRAVMKLGKVGDFGEWNPLALGMVEYRSGNDAAADRALLAAAEAGPKNRIVAGLAGFYRAMSLFRQGKKEEALRLAFATAAKMKPLPKDDNDPLADAGPNDLILWLAYKEAKAMILFDAPPPPEGKNEKK